MKHNRLKDVTKLLKSKCYILITDKEGIMVGDFKGFTGLMKIHTLKLMHKQTAETIDKLYGKEKTNGRNKSGRTSSSKNK